MGAAGFGGFFAPIVQYETWEIHKVFPHFPYFRLGQNLLPNLLVPLCGVALYYFPVVTKLFATVIHNIIKRYCKDDYASGRMLLDILSRQ